MNEITTETSELLKKTNAAADEIRRRMESFHSVVQAVENISATVESFSQSISGLSGEVTRKIKNRQEKIAHLFQLANAFLEIWEKWRERKLQNSKE